MKKRFFSLICVLTAFIMTGCSSIDVGDFNLTENEEEAIVGYAADLLLKYDANYQNNIVDTSQQRELQARVAAIKELNAQAREQEEQEGSDKSSNKGSEDKKEIKVPGAPEGEQNLAAAFEQKDFEIEYKGYEACTSYSNGEMFALDASKGKQLLVLHFDIVNKSTEEKQCSIISQNPMFRIIVNEAEKKSALTTILLNDLATVDETLEAGAHYDAVTVFETEPGYEEGIEKLSLEVKYNSGESVIPLK